MKAAIIAAGEGSRLLKSHPGQIKPMICIAAKPLIYWVVVGLRSAGCKDIVVLTNTRGDAVGPYLSAAFPDVNFDFVTADTASSFESFRLVCKRLATATDGGFVVSTVDALIKTDDVARFISECRTSNADAGLALTTFVDDEKPLWADTDAKGRVTALGADAKDKNAVTCGLYYMTRSAATAIPNAERHSRLRDYFQELVASGATVRGVILSKSLDVDRPEDLAAAESFLTTETNR
ncbi:MAG: NDP-sugar synthase [Elusimicrobiota bacterium]|nr:NDP-sugar synthase [Elusimicrobiota bacterium]